MQWTWTWTNFRSWWGTGKSGRLQSMESQSWTQLGDWKRTTTICQYMCMCSVFIWIHYLSLYYCVTKSPQSLVAYDNKHLSHIVSVNWESDRRLAGHFWLRVSHESIVKMSAGAIFTWRPDWAWSPLSGAHSPAGNLVLAVGRRPHFLAMSASSSACLSIFTTQQLPSSRSDPRKRDQAEATMLL